MAGSDSPSLGTAGADGAGAADVALLLVDQAVGSRGQLARLLTATGFAVTAVADAAAARKAMGEVAFAYAVVELRAGPDSGLGLVRELRVCCPGMRIVAVTGFDSFAAATAALRAGVDDYLAKPVDESRLIDVLLGRELPDPPVPETPLALRRVVWEHVQRAFEQCGRNVTWTAAHLGMHRQTLQRVLGKRAPLPRGGPPARGEIPKGSATS